MRIDCEHCGRAMQVPDDKVPDRVFTLTCPGCRNKITIDPTSSTAPVVPPAAEPALPPSGPTPASSSLESTGAHAVGGLRVLRSVEVELLEQITPLALVVDVDVTPDPAVDAQLKLAGMKEIMHLASLADAVDRAEELEAGMLVIRMAKAPAPPCEPLEPLFRMPTGARRKTFTILMADNVRTLDGMVAFFLQVNCLVNAQEIAGMAVPVRRALLFHLKHYRHWWDTQGKH